MLRISDLGCTGYGQTWQKMRAFTDARGPATSDELWLTEHPAVYTVGQSSKLTATSIDDIPLVHTDRGGLLTFHGPGQIVGYPLVDLNRAKCSVHDFVCLLEQSMIDTLAFFGIVAERLTGHPGIYVSGRKIGSLGIRVRRGCTYHGISLNVDMDLRPLHNIDPCGIPGMQVTQLVDHCPTVTIELARQRYAGSFESLWKSTTNDELGADA